MTNNKLSIVFIGFDGYNDLWDDCVYLFNKYWPDCPYSSYFVNNELSRTWANFTVINAGKNAEWSHKVLCALDCIETQYVCLLLEDFFIGNPVSTEEVDNIVNFMDNEQIKYLKIQSDRVFKSKAPFYKNQHSFKTIKQDDYYGVSLQPSIWDKTFLKNMIGKNNYNAWQFEFDRVNEARNNNNDYITKCLLDERNVLNIRHGVVQGCWLPNTIRYFKKKGINLKIKRPILSTFKTIQRKIVCITKEILPQNIQNAIKPILEKVGFEFVSTIRNNNKD